MKEQQTLSRLALKVKPGSLPLFTTVLQSGIEVITTGGETLGRFLSSFPGFTADYLADTVQTIFLNGTAVDDLTTPLAGDNPVLALSAAMPGLAGAIFRKNSFHAALRTETKVLADKSAGQNSLTVTLKLFNSIAKDRGAELLHQGVCIQAGVLGGFLAGRPNLVEDITQIQLNETVVDKTDLDRVLAGQTKVNLIIEKADD
jgi:hypothetical protein